MTDFEFLFISITRPRTFMRLWKISIRKNAQVHFTDFNDFEICYQDQHSEQLLSYTCYRYSALVSEKNISTIYLTITLHSGIATPIFK